MKYLKSLKNKTYVMVVLAILIIGIAAYLSNSDTPYDPNALQFERGVNFPAGTDSVEMRAKSDSLLDFFIKTSNQAETFNEIIDEQNEQK